MAEKTSIQLLAEYRQFIQDLPINDKDICFNTSIIEMDSYNPWRFGYKGDKQWRKINENLFTALLIKEQIIFETSDKERKQCYKFKNGSTEINWNGATEIRSKELLKQVDAAIGKSLLEAYLADVAPHEKNAAPSQKRTSEASDSEDDEQERKKPGIEVVILNSRDTSTGTVDNSTGKKTTAEEYPRLSAAIEDSHSFPAEAKAAHKEAVVKIMVKVFEKFDPKELEQIKNAEQPNSFREFFEAIGHFFNSVIRAVTFGKAGFDFSKKEARQAMNNPDGFTLDERYIQVLENEENKHATRLAKQKAEALKLQSQTKF